MGKWRMNETQHKINEVQIVLAALLGSHTDPEFLEAVRSADKALDAAFLFADYVEEAV